MSIFSHLNVWCDENSRSPAEQMAVDEAILRNIGPESGNSAFLRFYSWPKPATTLGFFMPFTEIAEKRSNRIESSNQPCSIVRRLTGGGIVEHGDDITFALVVGKNHPLSSVPTVDRYRLVHEALRDALVEAGLWPQAELVPVSAESDRGELACFSNPVGWDVVDGASGEKIAGGAQRRSGGAWLHQGTVKIMSERSISAKWTTLFAKKLGEIHEWTGSAEIETMATELIKTRYTTQAWNQRV